MGERPTPRKQVAPPTPHLHPPKGGVEGVEVWKRASSSTLPHLSPPHLEKCGTVLQAWPMNQLKVIELCAGAAAISANAAGLIGEAEILHEHKRYSRAYALSYMACEELGKLPILIGAATKLVLRTKVDWKTVTTSFRNHETKTAHFLGAAAGAILEARFDQGEKISKEDFVDQINEAQAQANNTFSKRNSSLYVDEKSNKFISPEDVIDESDSQSSMNLAKLIYSSQARHWGTSAETMEATLRKNAQPGPQALAPSAG
jgi:AbiV family abortive infection protein